MTERENIERLLCELNAQKTRPFPQEGPLQQEVPTTQGVYVLRNPNGDILHVGRTTTAKNGLRQRLQNHLDGKSSFVRDYLGGKRNELRTGCTFQHLEVPNDRDRALLENRAISWHCPKHLGLR